MKRRAGHLAALAILALGLCGCSFGAHLQFGDVALAWHQGVHHVVNGFGHVVIRLH